MTYEEVVKKAQAIAAHGDASDVKEHLAIQYNITGEGEGAFYLEVKDGKLEVQPYDYNDRDILVTASAEDILDMMQGNLDVGKAYLTGRIKAQGNLAKAGILSSIIKKSKKAAEKTVEKSVKKTGKAGKK